MRLPPQYLWVEIPDDEWESLVALARARDQRTAVASNSRYWTNEPNLLGLCGEWCYGVVTDQLARLDRSPEVWGRPSSDFPGVDVKVTTHVQNPQLRVYRGQGFKAPFYFAVAVDIERRLVKPLGYGTRAMLQAAPRRDYGHGTGHEATVIPAHDLLSADELFAQSLRAAFSGAEATG